MTRPRAAGGGKLVVLSDHRLFREAVVYALRQRALCETVWAASLEMAPAHACWVLLRVDGRRAEENPAIVRAVRNYTPRDVFVLTSAGVRRFDAPTKRTSAITPCVSIEQLAQRLLRALRTDGAGDPSVGRPFSQPRASPARGSLSPREVQIAARVASGLRNEQIAAQLLIATSTVDNHVHNIFAKLQLRSRNDLVRYGWERKWWMVSAADQSGLRLFTPPLPA